jgi:NADH-quinone oxidoreductase subunit L
MTLHLVGLILFIVFWAIGENPILDIKHLVLFKAGEVEIFIDFYFDKVTAVFALIGSLLTLLVGIFSRYYLHREKGFKRFFVTILFFFAGYNIVVFSGNFETFFAGWEILGICSFLLIAFYRDRYLPVKNGLKVISLYRLADVCLILAMWMSHHLWHENITFLKLNDLALVQHQVQEHYSLGLFIGIMLFMAAIIKSAQFPFSSWLPRAMEGPTTSSAIFYGSLSVHLGVFLLLRTYSFWEGMFIMKVLIVGVGLTTAIVATGIARVQSTVKTQIAYSSAAQIGIIFCEVALGFHTLALFHFAGNAFLRTYQLLVSPSVLSYLVHDQFYNFKPGNRTEKNSFITRVRDSFYILCVKEWNMDLTLHRLLWTPFKWIGMKLKSVSSGWGFVLVAGIYLLALLSFTIDQQTASLAYLPYVLAGAALILILNAFTERANPLKAWILIFLSQFFIALSVARNSQFDFIQIALYLAGGVIFGVIGYLCLIKMKKTDEELSLNRFHGYAYDHPKRAAIFLISCLGVVAFPVTPAFIGFDLLLTHIEKDQYVLIIITGLCFVFIELSVLRIYARIFLGQHKKTDHAMAYRSS